MPCTCFSCRPRCGVFAVSCPQCLSTNQSQTAPQIRHRVASHGPSSVSIHSWAHPAPPQRGQLVIGEQCVEVVEHLALPRAVQARIAFPFARSKGSRVRALGGFMMGIRGPVFEKGWRMRKTGATLSSVTRIEPFKGRVDCGPPPDPAFLI
jgi:hypothetical protein